MKTELKCKGCNKNIPEVEYDVKMGRPAWFSKSRGGEIIEWICAECWKKGVRYSEGDLR